ncbi:VgrG protein [Klebsiella michiganensis]|nr:VgrG protein [Klebsiella michiganensis]
MSEIKSLLFSHSHHLLTVRGCSALLDALSFEGEEALSEPFRYVIEFTSADKTITPQQMLMQDATFTLQAPADQGFGINIQQPVRTIQGVVTAFERLSASRGRNALFPDPAAPSGAALPEPPEPDLPGYVGAGYRGAYPAYPPRHARGGLCFHPGTGVSASRAGDAVRRGRPALYHPPAGRGRYLVPLHRRHPAEH